YLCYRVWAKAEEVQNVPVYNFAVENADSYIVNGIATHNCKGITVYRDSSRDLQVLTTGASEPKAEEQPAHELQTDTEPAPAAAPASLAAYERPQRMHGFTDQVKLMEPDGDKRGFFITVNSNGNDDPREVFIISGKGGDEANADGEALGRVVSIALQWGVPPEAIVKTLRGINGGMFGSYRGRLVHSKADLIAVALETANDAKPARSEQPASAPATASKPGKNGGRCPKCGGPLIRTEGCETCSDPACGYSRCG